MRVRRFLTGFGAILIGAALVLSWPAGAQSGSTSDADDTTGPIDVKTLTHSDTATKITYTMEAWETWPDTDQYELEWLVDLDGDLAETDACIFLRQNGDGGAFEEAAVYDNECSEKLQDGVATKTGAMVTFEFNRSAFGEATRPLPSNATSYTYTFAATHFRSDNSEGFDTVPNGNARITHALGGSQSTTTTTSGGGTTTTTGGGTTTTTGGGTTTTTTGGGTTTTTAAPAACPSPSRALVSPSTAVPGQEVTVRGGGPNCFRGNATLDVVFTSTPVKLGTTTSDAFGQYAVIVKIPLNATTGSHTITVSGPAPSSGTHSSLGGITVQRGSLPRTGGDSGDMTRLAIFSIGAGAVLVMGARRSRDFVLSSVRHQAKHFRR